MKKFERGWKIMLVILLVLVLLLVVFNYINQWRDPMYHPGEKDFAVLDTAAITSIFIADKKDNKVLLERQYDGTWILNKTYEAHKDVMHELMYTLFNMTVRGPVPLAMRDNAIREMAAHAVKVEIYARVYAFNLFGFKFFPYTKRIRTFYVGHATKDQTGSFFLMENSENPYILHIPGFMGFINSRFSPFERDWRTHKVFEAQLSDIKRVEVLYPTLKENSFSIEQTDQGFRVSDVNGHTLNQVDTVTIVAFLNQFIDVRFESIIDDASPAKLDSIKNLPRFCIIRLDKKDGNRQSIELIRIKAPEGSTNIEGKPIEYDPEYLWGVLPSGEVVMAQYFVFGPLMRQITEFQLKKLDLKEVTINK